MKDNDTVTEKACFLLLYLFVFCTFVPMFYRPYIRRVIYCRI